ncbi:MAG: hypothetical protein LBG15_14715, partial [Dysgonamonadaceae bacterium]|nr:hypothetical protein [Dysgonamonadaceae bacterium]
DTLYVNITNIGDTKISYAYPEESFTQNIAILTVKEIRFASGRIQKFTEPVVVTGEKDWEKVIISNNPEYVAGFEEYGPVKEMDMKPYGVQSVLEKNAIKKAKIIAARKGAHVVFVYSNQFSHSPWNNVTISGTAYGYSSE